MIYLILKIKTLLLILVGHVEDKNGKKDIDKIDKLLNLFENMKLKKGINIIDQHDKFGYWTNGKLRNMVEITLSPPLIEFIKTFFKN